MGTELNKSFEAVFRLSLDVLLIVDAEKGHVLHVNKAVQRLLGWQPENIIGKHFSFLFPEESEINLEKFFSYDGVVSEQPFAKQDGGICIMDLTATPIPWIDDKNAVFVTLRDVTERLEFEKERERLISELQEALANVDTLKGLLPICAACKKIRDDQGYWNKVENYFREHSTVEFTHTICPECARELYPKLFKEKDKDKKK